MSILIVVSSQHTRMRENGLGEVCRLVQAVNDAQDSRWSKAKFLHPEYSNHQELDGQAKKSGWEAVPIPAAIDITDSSERGSRIGPPPADPAAWHKFAERARQRIQELAQDESVDVLLVDWPMGPLAQELWHVDGVRTCFTVDLEPPCQNSWCMWRQGVSNADVVHCPTEEWAGILKENSRELCQKTVRHALFGVVRSRFELDQKAEYKERIVAEWFPEDESTERKMVIVVRNRASTKDQKNWDSVIDLLKQLLPEQQDCPLRIVCGPLEGFANSPVDVQKGLSELEEKYGSQLKYEKELKVKWDDAIKAADAQLLPSRFEPCGVNHAQGFRYGAIPIASTKGALGVPPVSDQNSFLFGWDEQNVEKSRAAFGSSVREAIECFFEEPEKWEAMQQSAVRAADHYLWENLVADYAKLFEPEFPE